MDFDFKTIRALSSPTRIEILSHCMDNEATPTNTAEKVGKSKSTVSSHLEKLSDASLVEKEDKEGRKRVVYKPTDKAEAIVKGRTRKVKFSIASSAITGLAGVGLLGYTFRGIKEYKSRSSSGPSIMMDQAENEASRGFVEAASSEPLLGASVVLIVISIVALIYALWNRKLE
jgi:DNA-binding transcriptional ArsR family regulator